MTQFPRIHLNGTDGKVLLEEYRSAIEAVRNAIKTVNNITVHGRDYYTIPGAAAEIAYAEHRQHITYLYTVEQELLAIAESIYAQVTP